MRRKRDRRKSQRKFTIAIDIAFLKLPSRGGARPWLPPISRLVGDERERHPALVRAEQVPCGPFQQFDAWMR